PIALLLRDCDWHSACTRGPRTTRLVGRTMTRTGIDLTKFVCSAVIACALAIGIAPARVACAEDAATTAASTTPVAESAGTAGATDAPPGAAAQPEAPQVPAYFSGTNDPAKPSWPDPTGGATGVWATPAGDGKGDVPSKLGIADLYDRISHNLVSINFVWALMAGFLVMFMQAGFMFVETGLCRAKNASHTAAMNFLIYPLGCLGFWAYGFAIGWGNWWNGPVAPGWYASLGPGLSVLNGGWGLGAAVDAAGRGSRGFTDGSYWYDRLVSQWRRE